MDARKFVDTMGLIKLVIRSNQFTAEERKSDIKTLLDGMDLNYTQEQLDEILIKVE